MMAQVLWMLDHKGYMVYCVVLYGSITWFYMVVYGYRCIMTCAYSHKVYFVRFYTIYHGMWCGGVGGYMRMVYMVYL